MRENIEITPPRFLWGVSDVELVFIVDQAHQGCFSPPHFWHGFPNIQACSYNQFSFPLHFSQVLCQSIHNRKFHPILFYHINTYPPIYIHVSKQIIYNCWTYQKKKPTDTKPLDTNSLMQTHQINPPSQTTLNPPTQTHATTIKTTPRCCH